MTGPLLGRLSWADLPMARLLAGPHVSEAIAGGAATMVVLGALLTVLLISWFRGWRPLWSGWLTTLDHKRIGIMYIALALVMLVRAVVEAALMRLQQAFGLADPLDEACGQDRFIGHVKELELDRRTP